ncbi:NDP-hexose 2,3-dehydratase family protein [Clostridium butyricum]
MCIHTIYEILDWILIKNKNIKVRIKKNMLEECEPWYYDEENGIIRNDKGSFFQISGLNVVENNVVLHEQPVILQSEIGYWGILCKEIGGILYFLMQAKIEPGNINKVQISSTIQATKSNFIQLHGRRKLAYLDYFVNANKYEIIVDQIKELMKYDNLVNMDTRIVLSCIPLKASDINDKKEVENYFKDKSLYYSMFNKEENIIPKIYNYINNKKIFSDYKTSIVPLKSLSSWNIFNNEIVCKNSFKVIFCDIEIEEREVTHWKQPLFKQ